MDSNPNAEPDVDNTDLVYVPELANLLATTESAIRTRLTRGIGVPPRYTDSTRVCWRRKDVFNFIKNQ